MTVFSLKGVAIMRGLRLIVGGAFGVVGTLAAASAIAAPVPRPPGAQSCIDGRSMSGQRAEDEETIIFTDGLRTYRNHLRTVCPGAMRLNSFGSLEAEMQGTQLCEGDAIRVFDPYAARTVGIEAYPRCVLGWFERVPNPPRPPRN